jgi:hypothetical protein
LQQIDGMTIVPVLAAAVLLVGGVAVLVVSLGRRAARSRVPRPLTENADDFVEVPPIADTPVMPLRLASGSMAIPPQTAAGPRPRLPGLTRTQPMPAIGTAKHRALTPRPVPTDAFSDKN